MTWKRSVLVVANVTATSTDLLKALEARADREPVMFTLVVPATAAGGGRVAAAGNLEEALGRFHGAGLEADGFVGDGNPAMAVTEAWDPGRFDEIIVSTLPMRVSKWLHAGLPERIAKLTGAPVTHVVSREPRRPPVTVPAPEHEKHGMITPFYALGVSAREPRMHAR
jgi:GABA permease